MLASLLRISVLLLLFVTSLHAGSYVGIDALFVKAMTQAPYAFAQSGEGDAPMQDLKLFSASGDAGWGVHAYGGYARCGVDLQLGYTWFGSSSRPVARRGMFEQLNVNQSTPSPMINVVEGNLKQQYQNVDLRVAFDVGCCFYAYGNVRWAEMHHRIRSTADTGQGEAVYADAGRFEGAGPGAGIGVRIALMCALGLDLRLGVTGLMASLHGGPVINVNPLGGSDNQNFHQNKAIFTPATDLRLDLNYQKSFTCFDMSARVGYLLDYYPNALSLYGSHTCDDFALSGLYFGVTAAW